MSAQLISDPLVQKLKHHGKIIWSGVTDPITIDEYLLCISGISEKDKEIVLKYKIIGYVKIHVDHYLYIISDPDSKALFVALNIVHPIYWYSYKDISEFVLQFDSLYEIYTSDPGYDFTKRVRGYLGDEELLDISIKDIENCILVDKLGFTDRLIWGSNWSEHPFRAQFAMEITFQDAILYTGQAMRQIDEYTYSVSVRTLFSKSIITFFDIEGIFVVLVEYKPIINKNMMKINRVFKRQYFNDFPMDVIMTLITFPFVNHHNILKSRPLTHGHFHVAKLLVNSSETYNDLKGSLSLITKDLSIQSELRESAEFMLQDIENENIINKIFLENKIEVTEDNLEDLLNDLIKKYDLDSNESIKEELANILTDMLEDGKVDNSISE